jgi:hypothetical protein
MNTSDLVSTVIASLRAENIDADTIKRVVEQLRAKAAREKAHKDPTPKQKNQYTVLLLDEDGKLPEGLTGWICQLPENENPLEAIDRIRDGVIAFNNSRAGRHAPIYRIQDALENLPARFLKREADGTKMSVKTKTPCQLVPLSTAKVP